MQPGLSKRPADPAASRRRETKNDPQLPEPVNASAMNTVSVQFPGSPPDVFFFPQFRLMAWHPGGVLDDARADSIVDFLESHEKYEGSCFNRYINMTGLTRIQIGLDHVVRLARRRRALYRGQKVRSAVYAVRLIGVHVARMYEELMEGSRIEARAFRELSVVADWLEVPIEVLQTPPSARE